MATTTTNRVVGLEKRLDKLERDLREMLEALGLRNQEILEVLWRGKRIAGHIGGREHPSVDAPCWRRAALGDARINEDIAAGDPVTTFKRSNALYSKAMSYNKGLARDRDGIACEKK